jgi:serine/threonine-protein kinase
MRIVLAVTAGPHEGKEFAFAGHDTFIVGRSKRAHFQLPAKDLFFSRVHFMVELNPPHCRLMDLGSRNGTCVNGQRVQVADLQDGDQIRAGITTLRVNVEGGAGAAPEWVPNEDARPWWGGAAGPPGPRSPKLEASRTVAAAPETVAEGTLRSEGSSLAHDAIPPPPREEAPAPGLPALPGYELLEELGRGGMGVVYRARRQADGALVALKMITPAVAATRPEIERFLREADILRALSHPNIVGFREMGEANGRLYFAMDYVPGTDAQRLLKAEGPLPVRRAVALVCQLLEALEHAHAQGYVHRDIKPGNLLVTQVDGREVVKLADFGLARVYQTSQLSGLTMMGDVGGTLAFVAPEQLTHFRDAKPAVDQYSAAATLYTLLTQRFVYDLPREAEKRLLMILQDDPVPLASRRAGLPPKLVQAVHRALARDPADRFADVQALRRALARAGG